MIKRLNKIFPGFLIILAVFCCAKTCDAGLKDVEMAIIQEDYESAITLAQKFIDSKPVKKDLDEALYYKGLSQLRLEKYPEAQETFNLLISGFPKQNLRDKAYLGFIDSLYLDGNYENALIIAEELLAKSPKSEFISLIYLKLARANIKLVNWQKAKDYLNKIIKEFPNSFEAHTAKQLLEEKQYFSVQVGAFLEQSRAERLVEELKEKGEYSYIVETIDREGRKFFRVRVGKLALLDEARKLKSKLAQLGYPTNIYP